MSERAPGARPAPLRGAARVAALAWLLAVVGLYVAIHVFDLHLVR